MLLRMINISVSFLQNFFILRRILLWSTLIAGSKKKLGVTGLDFSKFKIFVFLLEFCLRLRGKYIGKHWFWRIIAYKIKSFLQIFLKLPTMLLWSSLNAESQKKLGVTELDFSQIKLLWLKLGKNTEKTHFWRLIWNKITNFLQNFFILPLMLHWSSLSRKIQKKLGVTELDSSEMMQFWPSFSCFSPNFLTFSIQITEINMNSAFQNLTPLPPNFFGSSQSDPSRETSCEV